MDTQSALAARERPQMTVVSAADLGLNRLGVFLLAGNAALLVTDIVLFASLGISIRWSAKAAGGIIPFCALLVVWLNFYFVPGRQNERLVAELVFIVGMIVLFTNLGSLMQYGAVAVGAPYADWWLAASDAALGIHVGTLAAWTRRHPFVDLTLRLAYISFMPQLLFVVCVLAWYRDRVRLWEFAWHFMVCAAVAVAALIVCPAVCPPAYYGFQPTVDMTRLIHQIQTLHDGTMKVVRFDDLEGLVSFPSFHVAGALIVTWAVRARRWFLWPLACLNVLLIASTFLTGVHYFVDILGAIPLFVGSVLLYRRYWRSLFEQASTSETQPRSAPIDGVAC
jgi:hypothetical protein